MRTTTNHGARSFNNTFISKRLRHGPPYSTLGESIGLAAEAYEGVCTDLPPARKK